MMAYRKAYSKAYVGDSKHEIIEGVDLLANGKLHRFLNRVGIPYSAIYQDDIEVFSCERSDEDNMIRYWNKMVTEFDALARKNIKRRN